MEPPRWAALHTGDRLGWGHSVTKALNQTPKPRSVPQLHYKPCQRSV